MKELKGNCSLCSLACPLVIAGGGRGPIFGKDSLLAVEWDREAGSKFGGSLCARGNAVAELLSHPQRINYPFMLGERTTIAAAVGETAKSLADVKAAHGAGSIGVLLGENLTIEEADLAARFARDVVGTEHVALFAPDDAPIFRAHLARDFSGLKPAGPKPAGERSVALVFGDPFSEHPCTAKSILPMKYGVRGSEVIVASPETNHTAWFANRHLRTKPGGEAAAAAGLLKAAVEASKAELPAGLKQLLDKTDWSEIERVGGVSKDALASAARSMLGAAKVATYVSNIFGRFSAPGLVYSFAEALTAIMPGEREFVPQFVQQNTWGIHSVLASAASKGDCVRKLAAGELRALVILGLDLFSAYPAGPIEKAMREKRFTVTTQIFWNQTAERANIVLPAATLMEKPGTVSPAFGEDFTRGEVMKPLAGCLADGEFIAMLAREMGSELAPAASPKRLTARGSGADGISAEWAEYVAAEKELEGAEAVLIPWSEAVHAADGAASRNFQWSSITCPDAVLMVSEELASRARLAKGDHVDVSTAGGEIVLPVEITSRLAGKVAAATIHFPAVRKLFPWRLSAAGEPVLGPVAARLSRQSARY